MLQRVLLVLLLFCSFFTFAGDTVLKLYRPYGEVVDQAPLVVKTTLTGLCTKQSQRIQREDAWRCEADGTIYDPCFVRAGALYVKDLVCPQSPWTGDSVQIKVESPLNNQNHKTLDMSRAFPWAIELANGERCQAVDADKVFDGMPVRYQCAENNVLIGYLQRCKTEWSMLEKTAAGVKSVSFKRVWF
ncbi:MAG: hypothetical protein EPN84_05040 [Legionella sp.]|nr:MAG: hypothetical protein EPN84_05040 [Legionella sp.]